MTAPPTDDSSRLCPEGVDARARTESDAVLRGLASAFAVDEAIDGIEPLGKGLINDTFRITAGASRYVMQGINGRVFPHPEQIMANLRMLDAHIRQLGDGAVRLPALIPTREGASCLRDGAGRYWRMMELIPNAVSLHQVDRLEQAREIGQILGRFHRSLASLPSERLGLSLPGFHDTPAYLAKLRALRMVEHRAEPDEDLMACGKFVARRAALAGVLHAACQDGRIARRVTHGDPKLDNILFSEDGDRALALIDLDTVQPGLIHHDLGDCLRSCCNRSGEGSAGGREVHFDLTICEGILIGYAAETREMLSRQEIGLLFEGVRLLPFELGLRFLVDHLEGDRYFRVTEHGENLVKARVQFALVASIESQETAIRGIIRDCFGG